MNHIKLTDQRLRDITEGVEVVESDIGGPVFWGGEVGVGDIIRHNSSGRGQLSG